MNKVDKAKLAQQIDAMKSVCADGKREVRELVETLIGEKLTTPAPDRIPKPGEVWIGEGMYEGAWLAVAHPEKHFFTNIKTHSWLNYGSLLPSARGGGLKFAASSIPAFLENGGQL